MLAVCKNIRNSINLLLNKHCNRRGKDFLKKMSNGQPSSAKFFISDGILRKTETEKMERDCGCNCTDTWQMRPEAKKIQRS